MPERRIDPTWPPLPCPGPRALKVRRVAIDTYRENVAYLDRDCSVYRTEGFRALSKIEIRSDRRHILAVLNVVADDPIVGRDEPGLSDPAFAQFGARHGSRVDVGHPERPAWMEAVRRKIAGERLDQDAVNGIVADVTANHYSKTEIAAFIVATVQNELDRDDVLYLTRAMVASGYRLDWQEPLVADKHCIGGIPATARHCWSFRSSPRMRCLFRKPPAARSRRRPALRTRWKCLPTSS